MWLVELAMAVSSRLGAMLRELLSRGVLAMPTVTVVGPIDPFTSTPD